MNDPITSLQSSLLAATGEMLKLHEAVASLRASVNVLRVLVSIQMKPDAPEIVLEKLPEFERLFLKIDPTVQDTQEASQTLAAIRQWIQRGKPRGDS